MVAVREEAIDQRVEVPVALPHDDAVALEREVDLRHRVRIDARLDRELAHRRQLIAGLEPARGDRNADGAVELRVNGRRIAGIDV